MFPSKKVFLIGIIHLFFATVAFSENEQFIPITTADNALVFKVDKTHKLRQCYYGEKLKTSDYPSVQLTSADAFPTFGTSTINEAALRVVHADGNTSTELVFDGFTTEKVSDGVELTTITLKDTFFPFQVKLCFKAYQKDNVIEQWSEIRHTEKKTVMLYNFASSHLSFSDNNYYLTQFFGNWAEEMKMEEVKLTRGVKELESKLGVRSNEFAHACFYLSLNGQAQENTGNVIGGTLAWPGAWNLTFDVDQLNNLHVISGINSYASQYSLKPNTVFKTPSFLYSYSSEGTGNISRNFHRWAKQYGIYRGDKTRTTLLNNWEATYFNFNEDVLSKIIKDASDMGFELFLLDDGWFGDKYPRNDDTQGLGDWMVNKKKLPNGLGYLVREAKKNNIKFGIWLEPEMVNPKSELYEKHPDWVITQPNRPLDLSRNQLILDLCNPKVQDYVYSIIDKTMSENPGISYIKWDCNRFITNSGSSYLPANRQTHLWIDYTKGLLNVFKRVREKYTDLTMMDCSGGGGRIDYGTLSYFDEFWTSDNGDPLARINIQWGTSQFFPAICMASHVSSSPNHTTGRTTPLKFRFDVATSAKLGMDLQPSTMTEDEKAFCKIALKNYNEIKEVVQFGDLYRLLSPFESNRVAIMYTLEDQSRAVVYSYLVRKEIRGNSQIVYLKGLDSKKQYKLRELNKVPGRWSRFDDLEGKSFSGNFLMNHGVAYTMNDEYESLVFEAAAE